jgi:hypothetical protein
MPTLKAFNSRLTAWRPESPSARVRRAQTTAWIPSEGAGPVHTMMNIKLFLAFIIGLALVVLVLLITQMLG